MIAADHDTNRETMLSRLQLLNVAIMQAAIAGDTQRRRALVRERQHLRERLERSGNMIAA